MTIHAEDIKVQKSGLEAAGAALAQSIINESMAQAGSWGRYYRDLLALESWGRGAFKKTLNASVKDKDYKMKTDPAEDVRRRSAKVRISEFNTIARALDAGVSFDAQWSYHYAVGQARIALKSEGKASTKGRKATPLMDKIKAYIIKNVPAENMSDVATMIATMAQVHGADAPL